jgi:hypothetical protein
VAGLLWRAAALGAAFVAAASAACAAFGEAEVDSPHDASAESAGSEDAADSQAPAFEELTRPPCDPMSQFGPPEELPWAPLGIWTFRFATDRLVYGARVREGVRARSLFAATFTGTELEEIEGVFARVNMTGVNHHQYPMPLADGAGVLFEADRSFFLAARDPGSLAFGAASMVQLEGDFATVEEPWVSGSTVYFAFKAGDTGAAEDLAQGTLDGTTVRDVRFLTTVSTPASESAPVVSPDGQTIYFASMGWHEGSDYDIFVAHRADPLGDFSSPPRRLTISTPTSDRPTWISPNGCLLLFTIEDGSTRRLVKAVRAE